MHHGAPKIQQSHRNMCATSAGNGKPFSNMFNDASQYSDATVKLGADEILVHGLVIAHACPVLAIHWKPLWAGANTTVSLDGTCDECGISTSNPVALMFLEFFYTGSLKWPLSGADSVAAAELLVLGSLYDVPYVLHAAEIALRECITPTSCCDILTLADHHNAEQLKAFCLYYIAQGLETISTEGLSLDLQEQVHRKVTEFAKPSAL